MSRFSKCKIGVIQLNGTNDKIENYKVVENLMKEASSKGTKFVFLPECVDFISKSKEEIKGKAETIDGELISKYKNFASTHNLWISLGSIHLKKEDNVYNSHVIIDSNGQVRAVYDKVHLFDANICVNNGSSSIQESSYISHGQHAPCVVNDTPVGNLGLSICYDMRFPELSLANRHIGRADILCFPSAFAMETGQAGHWSILLRARAIESQTYVIAAAQAGRHHEKRESYGHSMVISPWGSVIAEGDAESSQLLVCDLFGSERGPDKNHPSLESVRTRMPVEFHRRFNLDYSQVDSGRLVQIPDLDQPFGPNIIKPSCIFYRSKSSFAFVNLSPLVPGHVLVSPIRVVQRLNDLTMAEITDLYGVVKMINQPLADHFKATSLTVSIQDGVDAGQSVPHVHVHVLPRKAGDFEKNDDIYTKLQEHDKIETRERRSLEAMSLEAGILRKLFY